MARQFHELPRSGRIYVGAVVCLGTVAIAHSVAALLTEAVSWEWLVLAGLILVTGSFSIKVPSVNARLSVSEAFVFAAILLYGLHVGTVIVAVDSLILTSWLRGPGRSRLRALFNMSAGALAIFASGRVFEWMLPVYPAASAPLEELLIPVLILAVLYFLVNSSLIATAVAYEKNVFAGTVWRRNFSWLVLNYLGGASVALVLVTYAATVNLAAVGVATPLLFVLYMTFRTSWGRIEDANRHVTQLNDLYMSTIEALAMAVDAKDQITHGHIRRVQVFAVELAKRLGVGDDKQLQAIATAALLHDMGKLAIPEHILNKPGKLTPAEFEKMKRHAEIGADLLSSVKFPYPVVPIVRHHHEHWDGTGYPAGISGTDIPLGARILAVVDCYDALTSDRPYRPRLTSEEAFQIIRDRRGATYDPLIVDTFIAAYAQIAPIAIQAGQEAHSLLEAEHAVTPPDADASASLRQIRANASEAVLLDACSRDMPKAISSTSAVDVGALYLRQLTPASVYALFLYDNTADLLKCVATAGDNRRLLDGLTIKLGERVTGWVGANCRSSVNSDPVLDLAQIASFFTPPLRSTMSTPLLAKDRLLGVLTAYSPKPDGFTEAHRYTFEHVALCLAERLCSLQLDPSVNVVAFPPRRH